MVPVALASGPGACARASVPQTSDGVERRQCDSLRLENQVLRVRVRELERANQELLARLGVFPQCDPDATGPGEAQEQAVDKDGTACPNCGRVVPAANFDAHVVHCERNFFRCVACSEVVALRDRDPHNAQWTGIEAISRAAAELDLPTLRKMRAHGAALESVCLEESQESLLHIGARKGSTELIAVALGQVAAPAAWLQAVDRDGQAALHLAVAMGHEAAAVILLEARSDPDQRNSNGDTPLLLACRSGVASMTRRLVEAGADIEARTALGDTVLQVAQSRGHLECMLALGQPVSGHKAGDAPLGPSLRPSSCGGPSLRPGSSGNASTPLTASAIARCSPTTSDRGTRRSSGDSSVGHGAPPRLPA